MVATPHGDTHQGAQEERNIVELLVEEFQRQAKEGPGLGECRKGSRNSSGLVQTKG